MGDVERLSTLTFECLSRCEQMSDMHKADTKSKNVESYKEIAQMLREVTVTVRDGCIKSDNVDKQTLVYLLTLCAIHSDGSIWTNVECVRCSDSLQTGLCTLMHHETITSLIAANVTRVLLYLSTKLTGEGNVWERNQCLMCAFQWIVPHITHPVMSEQVLDMTLAVALVSVDTYMMHYKVGGVRMLHHIMMETDTTELAWLNRCDVIYDALYKCLYVHEPEMVDALHPALLKALTIVEKSPPTTVVPLSTTSKSLSAGFSVSPASKKSSHSVFTMLLKDMGVEDKWALRRSYSSHLAGYITYLGITTVKHLGPLLDVIESYLDVSDLPREICRCHILRGLEAAIRECWPRMFRHAGRIVKCLYKLVCDVSHEQADCSAPAAGRDVITAATSCLITLNMAAPRETREILSSLGEDERLRVVSSEDCKQFVNTVLEAPHLGSATNE